MAANDRQVGGDHYGKGDYQHWDWATDLRFPYLVGVASKYVDRWRYRGVPEQDLRKTLHYLEKIVEAKVNLIPVTDRAAYFWRYVLSRNHTLEDAQILWLIQEGEWEAVATAVQGLLQALPTIDR